MAFYIGRGVKIKLPFICKNTILYWIRRDLSTHKVLPWLKTNEREKENKLHTEIKT